MGLGKVVGKQRMRTIEDAAGGQRVGGACDGTGPAKRLRMAMGGVRPLYS